MSGHAAWAVARFQLARLLAPQRLALALAGAAFPAAVMLAVRRVGPPLDRNLVVALTYAMVPEAICMLGLLLTMCPVVADELERGTWPHVAVRPGGRRALLVGTWMAAVAWTSTVAVLAAVATLAVSGVERPVGLAWMFAGLILLSCMGRAALFALPAVLVPKRALVAGVAVAVVVEYLAGFLPAVVNQVTVGLRLRSLLVSWMEWRRELPVEMTLIIDNASPWLHVVVVLALTTALLAAAAAILERRQFPPAEES